MPFSRITIRISSKIKGSRFQGPFFSGLARGRPLIQVWGSLGRQSALTGNRRFARLRNRLKKKVKKVGESWLTGTVTFTEPCVCSSGFFASLPRQSVLALGRMSHYPSDCFLVSATREGSGCSPRRDRFQRRQREFGTNRPRSISTTCIVDRPD